MCGGNSARPSYGGTIAILKPVANGSKTNLSSEVSLGMSNCAQHGKTTAIINGLDAGQQSGTEVLIHRDGDLRSSTTAESSVLHRIALPKDVATGDRFQLSTTLDLSVGGDGIIGRRVSLVEGGSVIGEGIMGWN